ncbi:hypothetical protein EDC04DRAFT_2615511 [Pisolithus marmoratus]|nr:hypothetical protein EDC04DRAFT_2615511 [Pisolithus marmoratus]
MSPKKCKRATKVSKPSFVTPGPPAGPAMKCDLDPIVELDEPDTPDDHRQPSRSEWMSVLADSSAMSCSGLDGNDVRSEKGFAIDGMTMSDNETSSDPDRKSKATVMKPAGSYYDPASCDASSEDDSLVPASNENRKNAGTKGTVSSSKQKDSPMTNKVEATDPKMNAGQYLYPPPPVTVQVMLPWPGTTQGYHGRNGMLYPLFSQQTIHPSPAALAYLLSPNLQPTIPQPPVIAPSSGCHHALSPFDPVATSNPSESTREIPKIVPWFNYLEQREKDPPCSVKFGDFGPMLDAKGFVRISQLSCDYISVGVLQGLLGIEMGTAILILQYVEADLQAIYHWKP